MENSDSLREYRWRYIIGIIILVVISFSIIIVFRESPMGSLGILPFLLGFLIGIFLNKTGIGPKLFEPKLPDDK